MIKSETYAGILNPPFDGKALAAGMRRMGDSRAVLPDYPNTVLAVNRAWAQKNRDALLAYLARVVERHGLGPKIRPIAMRQSRRSVPS